MFELVCRMNLQLAVSLNICMKCIGGGVSASWFLFSVLSFRQPNLCGLGVVVVGVEIELREITMDNFRACLALSVSEA
jgi:hypothetical protein